MTPTRIKCQNGESHAVRFHKDGTVTSTGCGDVTAESERIASVVKLGKEIARPSCAGLAALVQYGVASIFSQSGIKNGDELSFGGWRSIYQRFESLKVVEATVKRERAAARKRRKEAATARAAQLPEAPPEVKNAVDALIDSLPQP